MPTHLKSYYCAQHLLFIACSCYHRQRWLGSGQRRDLFLRVFEKVRQRYCFVVVGYVVMPEHIHVLISEPEKGDPSGVMLAIKQGFARRVLRQVTKRRYGGRQELFPKNSEHVWQRRFYDFNVWNERKRVEKLRYMHRNPVKRGLCTRPEDWPCSSFRQYATGYEGRVEIGCEWTARKRDRAAGTLCAAVELPHSSQKTA